MLGDDPESDPVKGNCGAGCSGFGIVEIYVKKTVVTKKNCSKEYSIF